VRVVCTRSISQLALALRWWRVLWLGWGVAVGLAAGNLAVTPPPAPRAISTGSSPLAATGPQSEAVGPKAEAVPAFALPAPSTHLATVSRPRDVFPPAEAESELTPTTWTEASGAASSAAQDEGAGETQPGLVGAGADVSGVEPADQPAAASPDEGGDPSPPATEAPAAGASQPPPSGLTMGTIRDPLRSSGWALRAAPSTSARTLISLTRGTRVQILPDTASGNGFTWLRVRTQAGAVGWVVANAIL